MSPFCDQKDKQRGTLVENVQENKEERKTWAKKCLFENVLCNTEILQISLCTLYSKTRGNHWGITAFYSLLSYQEISSTI
jgi:hypothetical protein